MTCVKRLLSVRNVINSLQSCSLHENKDYYRSGYQKFYLTPIQDRERLGKPLAEDDPYKYVPIKAAETNGAPTVFKDELLEKLTNMIMKDGRKELARKILSRTMIAIKIHQVNAYYEAKTKEEKANIECDPVKIIKQAIVNATPILHLTPYTRGGITYQVPTRVNPNFARFIAMKWFVRMCRDRNVKGFMHYLLAEEFLAAYKKEGRVMQAKYDLHKICETNRAYTHYRNT
uniref:Ribosomal protein S7 domain-containing protein n=1 Tax=Romanomermis culicivorax TaxID=13658 RepID=A0A915KRH4_ROMCU